MFRDPVNIESRKRELNEPHIKPLTDYVHRLRERELELGQIPYFDPWDGGTCAQALFLFEKPGPKAFVSGFISRNNNDPTAEACFGFFKKANLRRRDVCMWNVVPGWNDTRKIAPCELRTGLECVKELITLLSNVKVVVLVGKKAGEATNLIDGKPVIQSYHPSPIVRGRYRHLWDSIPAQWAQVREHLTSGCREQ
jgi:hypothetical protein